MTTETPTAHDDLEQEIVREHVDPAEPETEVVEGDLDADGSPIEEETPTLRMTIGRQLSFDVGGQRPTGAALSMSGKLALDRELRKGEQVVVNVVDENGEIVVSGHGAVVAVSFVDRETEAEGLVTTREHKVKFDT